MHQQKSIKSILIIAAYLLLPLIFYANVAVLSFPDFDGSFRWVYNYFWQTDVSFFQKSFHQVGPLMFLKWPYPMANHLWIATLFSYGVRVLLGLQMYQLLSCLQSKCKQVEWLIIYSILLLFTNFETALYANFLLGCFIYLHNKSMALFSVQLLLFCMGLFIKTTISIPLLCIGISFMVLLLIQKQWSSILKITSLFLILFCIISLLIYKNGLLAFTHVANDVSMVFAYSAEMNIYVINNTWYLFCMLAPFLVALLIGRHSNQKIVYWLGSLFLFAMWKYIIGRQDFEHYQIGLSIIILWFCILIVLQQKLLQKVVLTIFCLLSAYGFINNMDVSIHKKKIAINEPNFKNAMVQLWQPTLFKNQSKAVLDSIFSTQILPASILSKIGKHSVDVFPWEVSMFAVNALQPKFRPYLQTAVSGRLGNSSDAAFYSSTNSPKYILWHNAEPGFTTLDAFDGKYLPNEYPLAFWAIANHYQIIDSCNKRIYLLQKNTEVKNIIGQDSFTITTNWNLQNKLTVAKLDSNANYMLKASWQMPMHKKLYAALYKNPQYTIHYFFADGTTHSYNVSPRALQQGVFCNKIFMNQYLQYKVVKEISFSCTAFPHQHSLQLTIVKSKIDA